MAGHHAPRGYHDVTSYFTVRDAEGFIRFLKNVFGAEELNRGPTEGGNVTHAEVRIGRSIVEVSDANDRFSPRQSTLHVFVDNTDACYRRALEHGAVSLYEPSDMPYGERSAGVEDAWGNHWYIATFQRGEGRGYYD